MRSFLMIVGIGMWSFVVFLATWWLTFPSDELGLRLRAEVPARLGRDWSAEVGSVGPWWLGFDASDLRLYETGPDGAEPRAVLESATVAVSPFRSLLRRTPYFVGELTFVDGWIGYQLGTTQTGKKGNVWGFSDIVLWSDGVPLGDLLAITDKVPASITGNVAVDVDIRGATGLAESAGHIKLTGSNLTLSGIDIPTMGPLGFEIPIDALVIDAKVEKGQATFTESVIRSSWFTVAIKGNITLRDPIERSNVDLEFVVSELGPELRAFEGAMSSAKGTDGDYHFFVRGIAGRLSPASLSMGKPGPARGARRAAMAAEDPEAGDGGSDEPGVGAAGESDEERQNRRQEIRERLKKRREERRAERAAGKEPAGADDPEPTVTPPPVVEPDEPELDEEPIEEELPIEEEEPLE